jgi:phospholipase/carboxylesterase
MEEIIIGEPKPQKLIFVFHGYGANKSDLLPIGDEFVQAIPTARVHLPDGIEKCGGWQGYQWFPLYGEDVNGWKSAFEENSDKIIAYVKSIMEEAHLTYKDVIFSGFSQGAILSLNLGLKCGVQAIISFSGVLFDLDRNLRSSTKVLLSHGAQDNVIDVSATISAEQILKNAGIQVETIIENNCGHGIDNHMLSRAVDFLKSL